MKKILILLHSIFPPLVIVSLTYIVLSLRLLLLVKTYAVNLMLWDQWDYEFLFAKGTFGELFFHQHGPHRQGLGFIIAAIIERSTHWDTRAECYAIALFIISACLMAILLKKRILGKVTFSDISIPLIFLTPVQADTLLLFPNLSIGAFPLFILMIYLFALTLKRETIRYTVLIITNTLLIYSGYWLIMGIITPILITFDLIRHKHKHAHISSIHISALATSLLVFASFFINYTFTTAAPCFSSPLLFFWVYPLYMSEMIAHFIGAMVVVSIFLLPLGICILYYSLHILYQRVTHALAVGIDHSPTEAIIISLISFSLLYSLAAGIGRLCYGFFSSTQSRYMIFIIPLYLGLYLSVLLIRSPRIRNLTVAIFTLMMILPHILSSLPASSLNISQIMSNDKQIWMNCYRKTADVAFCNKEANLPINDYPKEVQLEEKLQYLRKNHLNFFYDHE